jgi:hypothetical protein
MVSELFPVMDILTLCKESLGLVGSCRHFFASRPLDCFSPPTTRYPLLVTSAISNPLSVLGGHAASFQTLAPRPSLLFNFV